MASSPETLIPSLIFNRQKIVVALQKAAQNLGRTPPQAEFTKYCGISKKYLKACFGNFKNAVQAAGLHPGKPPGWIDDQALLADWGGGVRKTGRILTLLKYRREGKFDHRTFVRLFGRWRVVPQKFREFAKNKPQWRDVVEIINRAGNKKTDTSGCPKIQTGHIYSNQLNCAWLRHEPTNENGVIYLFGVLAPRLGYMVETIQVGFPDCEAKQRIAEGRWRRVRIEFEYESRNFREHGHDPDGCNVIVCWRHNWKDCPPTLEVVELAAMFNQEKRSADFAD